MGARGAEVGTAGGVGEVHRDAHPVELDGAIAALDRVAGAGDDAERKKE